MPVPRFQNFLAPVLSFHRDGEVHWMNDIEEACAEYFGLDEQDLKEATSSGQTRLRNRTQWALVYLRKAGLLESVGRGRNRITDRGRAFLEETGGEFGLAELDRFEEFREFHGSTAMPEHRRRADPIALPSDRTPEEQIREAWQILDANLRDEVLEQVKAMPPDAFERLVVQLLLRMGYGSADEGAGQVTGRSGDEGIDGLISEDPLGLDKIYLQAKRYTDGKVRSDRIREFVGALVGKGAKKGVFLTTAEFSDDARHFAEGLIDQKVVLVDGPTLARLMVEHDLGVSLVRSYPVKRLDRDFFQGDFF